MSERSLFSILFCIIALTIVFLGYYTYASIETLKNTQTAHYEELQQTLQTLQENFIKKLEMTNQTLTREIVKTTTLQEELSGKVTKVETAVNQTRKENQHRINKLSGQLEELENTSNEKLSTLEGQLKNVRITNKDFSAIIKDIIKSVVSIKTNKGIGSGVVVDKRGYVLTNHHVIADATQGAIITYDKQVHPVKVIGIHEASDLAVLQFGDNTTYPALDFEERAKRIDVGTKVIAIGNPGGLEFSVTEGIISNAERTLQDIAYIQHDVPINPGNSGGPLLNIEGHIVGINTKKHEGFEGIGFAIHARIARAITQEVIRQTEQT